MEMLEDYFDERRKEMEGQDKPAYSRGRVAFIACRDERDQAAEEALYE